MPPQFALVLYVLFVVYLFWVDRRTNYAPPCALWIPLGWAFFALSRFPSQWWYLGTSQAVETLEGSPIDSAVFATLIGMGLVVLVRRQVNWRAFFILSVWVWLYFAFGALSVTWSDYPVVAVKRLIKAFGNVVMLAIILTEPRPYEALGTVVRRAAFMLIPLSIVFAKYFPDLGRSYHMGLPMFTGVAGHKNGLGQLCLISGMYFSWRLLLAPTGGDSGKIHFPTYVVMLAMIGWLLYMADSATSTACLAVAIGVFVLARRPTIRRKPDRLLLLVIGGSVVISSLELVLDLSAVVIEALGRRPDLTTRVPMWLDLLGMVGNPLVGYGYESFWLGPRQEKMRDLWGITSQAHNGYLEMYLNMGLTGLFFLFTWVFLALARVRRTLTADYPAAVLRLSFVVVALLYNWTEASFYGVNMIWMLLLFSVIAPPARPRPIGQKLNRTPSAYEARRAPSR
jgi:O-antigen ligase